METLAYAATRLFAVLVFDCADTTGVVAGITLTLAILTVSFGSLFSGGLLHFVCPAFASGAILPGEGANRAVPEREYQNAVIGNCDGGDFCGELFGVVFRKPQRLGTLFLEDILGYALGGAFALAPISERRASPCYFGVLRADGVNLFAEVRPAARTMNNTAEFAVNLGHSVARPSRSTRNLGLNRLKGFFIDYCLMRSFHIILGEFAAVRFYTLCDMVGDKALVV